MAAMLSASALLLHVLICSTPVAAASLSRTLEARAIRKASTVLHCSSDTGVCATNSLGDTRLALQWLADQLDPSTATFKTDAAKSTDDSDPLLLLRGTAGADGGRSIVHCEWMSCGAVRIKKPLPDSKNGKRLSDLDCSLVLEARARIESMIAYLNLAGMQAGSWCENVDGDASATRNSKALADAANVAKEYGLTVHYWQKGDAVSC
ncbi:hypothetical protein THASP1DRAFT_30378 [Thamnocephalis sphaerospora]|uniref:Lysozyme-like domain-containing protein n=1 Tax=Thamnocephalis sphaerospora TaxID=78915 RepID=A0A4P9XP92_9FUNG|nr:hypothetical protein THASP1DRAFT_30378 [Thamnocephalis sphaerospora]|eukprot:RKP07817.1 hypothetical protein THASP1DRAFT_30378 [Thamnocephalis sphaerospora]